MSFLLALLDLLFPPREDERIVRDLSSEGLAELVAPVLVAQSEPAVTALLPFSDARVRATVHEAKYHGNTKAFGLLAGVLSEYLLEIASEEGFARAVLVPIPLSRERRRARGWNQAEEIAKRAATATQLEMKTNVLERIRDTVSQTSLSRFERRENLSGAFRAGEVLDPSTTYLLIDDVVTTGATLEAAARALRAGGAEHILAIALAH
jgi:ComF family protein